MTGNDIAAGNAQPAADGLKHDDQVGIQAAVTSHENTEIVTQRGFAFGVRLGDLINLIKIKFADFECGADIKIFKQGFDLFKACLLYTSDAADDLLCVDLGGRRQLKKKKTNIQKYT